MPKLPAIIPDEGPDTSDRLTEMQRRFVVAYTSEPAAIANASAAARMAGYSERTAAEIGRQLLEKRHVKAAIDNANREAVSGRLATKAIALLERVIDDEEAPLKVRVEAAKSVLDRGGFVAPSAFERASASAARSRFSKALGEMTREEIALRIAELRVDASDPKAPPLVLEGEVTG